jgi:hypothetical protein
MWVVGILRPFSKVTDETIGRELQNIWQEGDLGEGESGPVGLIECGTAELGDRLTALWENGCPISIVGIGSDDTGSADDCVECLDLAVIEVDVMRFDATELGSVLARLDQKAVPFFFLMSGVADGKGIPPEIPLTLAQFGTVCPFPLSTSERAAGLRQLRDYVLQRLDKHYGERESAAEPKTPAAERRAFPRWQLDCPAMATIGGRDHPCRVVDISGGGIALDLAIPCEIGGEIVVNLEEVRPLRGKVVHIGQRHVGVQFTMDAAEHSEALALIAQVVAGRAQAAE